ncbi:CoA transferase [Variovorax sp. N23]|nr:CoA transferase [Variovorax sp. N23]
MWPSGSRSEVPLTHKSSDEWLRLLQDADIAAQPCHTLESLQGDPHLQAVELLQEERHPTKGEDEGPSRLDESR